MHFDVSVGHPDFEAGNLTCTTCPSTNRRCLLGSEDSDSTLCMDSLVAISRVENSNTVDSVSL